MVQLPNVFDPNTVAPSTGEGGNLPVSDAKGHLVVITDSSMEAVKDKQGCWYLQFNLSVTEGQHAGAEGPMRLNLGSDSAVAVKIAMQQLSAICHCVNYLQPINDVSVLYNRPFRVVVGLQKDKESADKGYTEIKKILDAAGNKPGHSGPTNGPSASPAPAPSAPSGFPPAAPVAPAPQQQFAPQPQQQPQQFAPQQQPQYAPQPQFAPQQQQPQQAPNPQAAPWAQPR